MIRVKNYEENRFGTLSEDAKINYLVLTTKLNKKIQANQEVECQIQEFGFNIMMLKPAEETNIVIKIDSDLSKIKYDLLKKEQNNPLVNGITTNIKDQLIPTYWWITDDGENLILQIELDKYNILLKDILNTQVTTV